jgi:hypothetical protein
MDPATRLKVMDQLATQSGGKLELFFASYDLGDAYAGPSKGWGKAKRISEALAEADRKGMVDEVLAAATRYFGISTKQADESDELPTTSELPNTVERRSANPRSPVRRSRQQSSLPSSGEGPEAELFRQAFRAWDKTGEWPIARVLQRKLERDGSDIDVEMTGRGLDRNLAYVEQQHNGRLVLRVGALIGMPDAEPYTSVFVAAVQLAYRRYVEVETDEAPVLSDEDLRDQLSLDPEMIWRLYTLLDGESFLLESGGSDDKKKTFRRDISPQIRHFRNVQTGEDYLRARAELLRPFPDGANPGSGTLLRRARIPRTSDAAEWGGQVFNTVILGGYAAVGPNAAIHVNVTPGDLASLMAFLAEHGIDEAERQELTEAIGSDAVVGESRPGRSVTAWLGKVSLRLAASGARVGEATAATVIGTAIARYLGLV